MALVSVDRAALSQMVGVCASAGRPLRHKVQNFSSGTAYLDGRGKGAAKWL